MVVYLEPPIVDGAASVGRGQQFVSVRPFSGSKLILGPALHSPMRHIEGGSSMHRALPWISQPPPLDQHMGTRPMSALLAMPAQRRRPRGYVSPRKDILKVRGTEQTDAAAHCSAAWLLYLIARLRGC